jgi:hypothetical protein
MYELVQQVNRPIVTISQMDDRGSIPDKVNDLFLFLVTSRPERRPIVPRILWYRIVSLGVRRPQLYPHH